MTLRHPFAAPTRAHTAAALVVLLASATPLLAGAVLAQQPQQRQAEQAGAPVPAGNQTDMQQGQRWATELIGSNVYGPGGQQVGDVYDLVVEPSNGRVAAAVLAVGGFLGIGEKRVAVPIAELKFEGDRLTTDMTRERLQNAPAFAARSSGAARSR